MTKYKFCGLTRSDEIKAAVELEADYIGFVFWEKSRRYVNVLTAKSLRKSMEVTDTEKTHPAFEDGTSRVKKPQVVGVFVDENPEKIEEIVRYGIIDIVQLHGHEDEKYIEDLRKLIPKVPVIQAFRIKSTGDIERAKRSTADFPLLDSGMGTGSVFDWQLIKESGLDRPYFLAGGLDVQNVTKALEMLTPMAVDVSSGIEINGRKDTEKMRLFAERVRCAKE